MSSWSGPAMTAKIFLPLILALIAGLIVVPVRDIWTAGWFVLVVLPVMGAATWLFSNIGEIRSSSNGVLYRKWRKWYKIPASEVSDVVRVFPCFAALVVNEHTRLFFFPDPDTRRLIRSLPAAMQSSNVTTGTADVTPAPQKRNSIVRGFFSFLIGVVLGTVIWQTRSPARNHRVKSVALLLFESRYLPLFVGVSVMFLSVLVIARRRLKARELDISLAMIGLGIVYLSSFIVPLL